jgi:methyl-accepting chemotaxis protein
LSDFARGRPPAKAGGTAADEAVVGRLSVSRKLYLAFGSIVALLVAVVAVAFWALSSLGSEHHRVADEVLPQVLAADATRAAAADMHFSQTRAVVAPETHSDYLADRRAFEQDLATTKRLTGSELADELAAVTAAASKFDAVDARVWSAVRAGDGAAAKRLVTGVANETADQLDRALTAYSNDVRATERRASARFRSTHSLASWLIGAFGIAAVLVAALLALLIGRALVGGIRQLLAAAEGIAGGDVEQSIDVTSRDELGETAAAFGRMVDYLREMVGAAERIAACDLTVDVRPASERDALGGAFGRMTANLRRMVGLLADASTAIGASSQQMASTSEEAGRAVGEIADAIGHVAAGAERQTRMVEQARVSTQETGETADQAVRVAEDGIAAAEQANLAMEALRASTGEVTEAIRQLAQRSEQIGGIVETITGIAGQTNLLALNAAIEAARAGEQGRGFAVVAEEVRKLAEESQQAAASIATLVQEIQAETERTVDVVEEGARRSEDSSATVETARAAFQQIAASVADIRGRIGEIVEASSEVAAVAEQSSATTQQVSASTEETSASTQQIAASAQELARAAQQLQGLVGQFRLAA